MELFWKGAAGLLLTAVLSLAVGKGERDIAQILTAIACSMGIMVGICYLEPVMELVWELQRMGDLQADSLGILLKAAGIALVAEVGSNLCTDAGNSALGKTFQMMASMVILYLSIPLFRTLLALLRDIMGEV